jgi:outer membrane receptor protein involved in Fe transport
MLNTDQIAKISPKTTVSAIANYTLHRYNFNVNTFYHSSSDDRIDPLTARRLDDYIIVNSKVSYNVISALRVYFEMENIFDEQYDTSSVTSTNDYNIQNRGRLSYIGLDYSF